MKILKSLLVAGSMAVSVANAQSIEFTVHAAPGGPSDTATRIIAKEINDKNKSIRLLIDTTRCQI